MHVLHGIVSRLLRNSRGTPSSGALRRLLSRHPSVPTPNTNVVCPATRKDTGIRSCASSRTYTSDFIDHTTRRKLPEPRGLPLIGTMLRLVMNGGAKRLHEYVDKRHQQLGPIYREQIGPVRGVFVNSPDEFRRIFRLEGTIPRHYLPESWLLYNNIRQQRRGLLFMEGDEWLHYRRILNKLMLLPNSTKIMCAPCQEAAVSLTENWRLQSCHSTTIQNLERQLYQWSIEVMLATLMGSRWRDCEQQLKARCEHLAVMLHQIFEHSVRLSIVPAKLAMRLKLSSWMQFVRVADEILDSVRSLVPEMTQLGGNGLLLTMADNGIRDEDAVRIIGDFVIAAGDTTATTMSWALLLLSGRLELQDELFNGIKDLPPEKILQHPLLRSVVKETLRLYPVAPFLTKYLSADGLIGDYFVSKEDLLILSIWSSGHSAEYYPQPEKFQPERWIRTKEGNYQGVKHPYGTLPFSMGARSCIGRKIAETQICLTLAQLIKNFWIECENRDNIKMILHLISVPSEPIRLKLTERKAQLDSQ